MTSEEFLRGSRLIQTRCVPEDETCYICERGIHSLCRACEELPLTSVPDCGCFKFSGETIYVNSVNAFVHIHCEVITHTIPYERVKEICQETEEGQR